VIVLVAIGVFRALQASALRSIQLASTLSAVARRGRSVIEGVYPDPATDASEAVRREPAVAGQVLWRARAATLQTIDVPALVRCAERSDVLIELCVHPGEVIQERGRVAVIHGDGELAVRPEEVVQAGDGCLSPEGLVSAVMVVVVEPAVKGGGALCA
jgi:uncharacterized membrane protein